MTTTFEAVKEQELREIAAKNEALDNYADLVRDIARGETIDPSRVDEVCRAAGKSAAELGTDVKEFDDSLEDGRLVERAKESLINRERAKKELSKLESRKRELHEQMVQCRKDIEAKEQIIRQDDRLQQARGLAEGRLVDRCRDHRKTQYRELGEWMKDTSRKIAVLESELDQVSGELSRKQNELDRRREENPEARDRYELEREVDQLATEVEDTERQVGELKAAWQEASKDKQQLRESMFSP